MTGHYLTSFTLKVVPHTDLFRPNEKISVFQVAGLKILGRGTHIIKNVEKI